MRDSVTITKQPGASYLLQGYRVPASVNEALKYLYSLSEPIEVLQLYRHYFPEEFARSDRSMNRVMGLEAYSPMEYEFLQLINEHMFPISDWLLSLGRVRTLPIAPQGIEWWEIALDEFRDGWQFLLVLAGVVERSDYGAGSLSPATWEMLEALRPLPQQHPWEAMKVLCPKLPEPLCHLGDAIAIIDHSTGNAWFDADSETPIDMVWCEDHMDTLAEWWREGKPMWDGADALASWLEESEANQVTCLGVWRWLLEKPMSMEQANFILPFMGQEIVSDESSTNAGSGTRNAGDAVRARRTPTSILHREIAVRRRRRRAFAAGQDALIRRVSGGGRGGAG